MTTAARTGTDRPAGSPADVSLAALLALASALTRSPADRRAPVAVPAQRRGDEPAPYHPDPSQET